MNAYVQLNDIFDTTSPTVLEQRAQRAFGNDGTDFWGNFFFCNAYHPDENVIYLFTEYQLRFLWDWWHNKYKTSDKDVRLNLDASRQKLFNTLEDGRGLKEIRACYISSHESCLDIRRVRFGMQPTRYLSPKHMMTIDFFDGRFWEESPSEPVDENECRRKLLDLAVLRKEIAKEFGGPKKENPNGAIKKWLRYLGPSRHVAPQYMDYCAGLNGNCPLAGMENSPRCLK